LTHSPTSVQISRPLSNYAVTYDNTGFIAEEVFPALYVPRRIGKIYKASAKNVFQEEQLQPLDDRDPLPQVGVAWDDFDYSIDRFGLKDVLPDLTEQDQDEALDQRGMMAQSYSRKLMLKREIDCATLMSTDATFNTTHRSTPSNKWDVAAGDPIADIGAAKEVVWKSTGMLPNTLIMGRSVWLQAFEGSSVFIDRLKNVIVSSVTPELAMTLLPDIQRILIANPIKDTGEGDDVSMAAVWGNHAWLTYTNPMSSNPMGGMAPITFGRTLRPEMEVTAWNYASQDPQGEFVCVQTLYDLVVVEKNCGYFFKNIIT
jgi:hypothetical protein